MKLRINYVLSFLCFAYLSEFLVARQERHFRVDSINALFELESALFLTPLLEDGNITEARERARVQHSDLKDVESYSGYLTVKKEFNSNLFFWYFPSKGNPSTDPLILWLQGGPGAPSLFGLFTGNGPLLIDEANELKLRNITWVNDHNVLYIDSPVGTGFSFTDDEADYATSINDVVFNLYIALQQFFMLFPELRNNEFYVTGESYGGKYVPALSYVIHKANENDNITNKIKLCGLAIGNGWTDPITQLRISEHVHQIGLVDEIGRKELQLLEDKIEDLIIKEKYVDAFHANQLIINENTNAGLFDNMTGYTWYYNYLYDKEPPLYNRYVSWLRRSSVRKALHVGNQEFEPSSVKVYDTMADDFMRSVADVVAALLENYRVLLYYGQLDIVCAYPVAVHYLQRVSWPGSEEYKSATRNQWFVGNDLAGYVKSVQNLTEVLIRNAGHMVPTDQPLWTSTMISHFTRRQQLYTPD